jgi:chromate reductase
MSQAEKIRILGIPGSLRNGSFNRAALRAAQMLVLQSVTVNVFELDEIPLYNQDNEFDPPIAVSKLKKEIRAADAILFVTPEYNYSVPGVLKNAIDWASRPHGDSAWDGKPVAIMGASIGMMGTARAQYHLRQMFVYLNMHALNRPEVMIPLAQDKFDQNGDLRDEFTKKKIQELMIALAGWTIRHKRLGEQEIAQA